MGHRGVGQRAVGAVRRRWLALLLATCSALALSGDGGGPLVSSGGSLSASALRAALDARVEVRELVREQIIDARRTQIFLRDRVAYLEQTFAPASVASVAHSVSPEAEPLEAGDDPWTEAGIVAGRIANAGAINDVFTGLVTDVANFREFQGLLVGEQVALRERAEALEDLAGILDPPGLDPLQPNEDEFAVPHTFAAGSVMRASEMNANLQAVDAGLAEEGAMAAAIVAQLALLEGRVGALELAFGLEPSFTWRIGTFNSASGIETEAFFAYRSVGPFQPFTITVTGPGGFERDVSATRSGFGDVGWSEPLLPSGTYTAVAAFSGVDFTTPIAVDASRVLDRPSVTVPSASASEVAVTFGRVEGAAMYFVEFGMVGGSWRVGRFAGPVAEPMQTVTFTDLDDPDLDLDPAGTYEVSVAAATTSFFELWSRTFSPQQVDISHTLSAPFGLSAGD